MFGFVTSGKMQLNDKGRSFFIQLKYAIYFIEMLASLNYKPAKSKQTVKVAAGASSEVCLDRMGACAITQKK